MPPPAKLIVIARQGERNAGKFGLFGLQANAPARQPLLQRIARLSLSIDVGPLRRSASQTIDPPSGGGALLDACLQTFVLWCEGY